MLNTLLLATQLLDVAVAAAQAGMDVAAIIGAGAAKVKAAQESGVDLTDADLAAELDAIKAGSAALATDPGASRT